MSLSEAVREVHMDQLDEMSIEVIIEFLLLTFDIKALNTAFTLLDDPEIECIFKPKTGDIT